MALALGAALGAAGSIFGGISAAREARKVRENINSQLQDNQNWYNRRYNEDATQRADAQRILTITEDSIRSRNRNAAGRQAVMGGTEEAAAATKSANNEALASATSQIAANGEARKDAIEQQYQQNKQNLENAKNNISTQTANNIGQAVQNVANVAGSIVGTEDNDKTKTTANGAV